MKLIFLFLGIAIILISIGIFVHDEIQDYLKSKPGAGSEEQSGEIQTGERSRL